MEKNICSVEELIREIDKHKLIPTYFGINNDDESSAAIEDFTWDIQHIIEDAYVRTGCSKAAIIIDNFNKVIKIPFSCEFFYVWDEEENEYNYSEEHWEMADVDYCEIEAEHYELAEEHGFAEFFAKTEYYGMASGSPIYLQERAIMWGCQDDEEQSHRPSKDSLEKASKIRNSYTNEESEYYHLNTPCEKWLAIAIEEYGLQRVHDFLVFINAHDMASDLHSGNYGFRASDNKPVLVDYSGFNGLYQ